MKLPVYMDHHATTPCDPRVLETMLPFFTQQFGNASSHGHFFGWQAAEAVKIARESVASLLQADPAEIIFTSGATEAVNLAIKGVYELFAAKGRHIITVQTEHQAVLESCRHLEKLGAMVTYLPVQEDGLINPDALRAAIRPDTILVAVMYANNETGVIQPVQEIGAIARELGIFFFSDATQAVGKIPVNMLENKIDLLACSAHKLSGPKGVGALYMRRKNPRVRLMAQQDGGGQENGFRSGTLNVPGIAGFGKAAALAASEMEKNRTFVGGLRDQLERGITGLGKGVLNGHPDHRLPTVTNWSFAGAAGRKLMQSLLREVAFSSGSACSSASPEPSHVLKAMGLNDEMAFQAFRFSLGKENTEAEVDYVIEKLRSALKTGETGLSPAELLTSVTLKD